mgnify:FL=1
MGGDEQDLLESIMQRDAGFSRLVDRHSELDETIRNLESKTHISAAEEVEIRRLKKLKLQAKDEMTQALKRHRSS